MSARSHCNRTALLVFPIIDPVENDVVSWYKARAGGRGYQTLMNAALREGMRGFETAEILRQGDSGRTTVDKLVQSGLISCYEKKIRTIYRYGTIGGILRTH